MLCSKTPYRGTFSGTVDVDGRVRLQAGLTQGAAATAQTTTWDTWLKSPGQLVGTFVLDNSFGNGFGPQHLVLTCELTDFHPSS